ncbi:peptidoglycan DD-metalloendopeptidase family protein [Novosphingobium resinovorum]|uniref:Peptidase M23 domain-containing protein n=1 Tax=Novosphingobium resinovorum TaxID=158500 RepID=A0A1D8A368_9SPHN|nr:peptidoglycan DD-metalloendopeptidase family protein [Novosphingobium resinovorum]AOR76568.1 hypothetical protein BES08_07260 [Novosphingobium resinovorum]
MATGRQTDVSLVIRARDEGTKAVKAFESALSDLLSTQKQVASGSTNTASGITQTISALAGLDKAYSQISGSINRGADAFERQLTSLASNQAQLRALTRQLEAARAAQSKMDSFVGPPTREAMSRYQGVAAEVKNLEAQYRSLEREVSRQDAGFQRSASDLAQLERQTRLVGAVTTFAKQESEQYTRSLDRQNAAAEKAAALQASIARSTNATSGKSAEDSASVFTRAGLTDTERAIAAVEKETAARERAAQAEREYAQAVEMSQAAQRARARIEGNGGSAGRAGETALADMLRQEEAAAQAAADAEAELVDATARLRSELNPLAAIQDKLNRELAEAQKLYDRGKISATELAQAQTLLRKRADDAAQSLGQQNVGGGKPTLFGLKPYEMQNLSFQLNDIVTQLASGTSLTQTLAQQGGQIIQIFPRAGSMIVAALGNPAVLAAAAAIGAVVIGLKEAGDEAERLRGFLGQLAASADGNSYGAGALNDAAEALDRYGLSAEDAVAAVRKFVREGVDQSRIEQFGEAASNLSDVMGVDLKDAVNEVADAFTGGYEAVKRLDDSYDFLTAAQRDHIRTLFEEGRAAEGRNEALDIFSARQEDAAQKMRGPWASAMRELSAAWQEFKELVGDTQWIRDAGSGLAGLGRDAAAALRQLRGAASEADVTKQLKTTRDIIAGIQGDLKDASALTRGGLQANLKVFQDQEASLVRQLDTLKKQNTESGKQGDTIARQSQLSQKQTGDLQRATAAAKESKSVAEAETEARRKATEFVEKEFKLADEATKQAYIAQEVARAREATQKRISDQAKKEADERKRAADEAKRLAQQTQFIDPVSGRVSSGYGQRTAPKAGASTFHRGVDFAVPTGTQVKAPAKGVVVETGYDSKLGKFVYIDHGNNTVSKFGHLSDNAIVSRGQIVEQGQTIGRSGNTGNSTGAHLHYQVEVNGKAVDPQKGIFVEDGLGRFKTDLADAVADYDKVVEKQQEFLDGLDRANAARELETTQLRDQSTLTGDALLAAQRQADIETQIAKVRDDASKAGIAADDPALELRIQKLREVTGAYFDAANARQSFENQRQSVDQPVQDLSALRDSLQQRIQYFEETGQRGLAQQLMPQLDMVNSKLLEAISNAQTFYSSLAGNPEAMAALGLTQTQVDTIRLGLDASAAAGQNLGYIMGISGQQIAQAFASNATDALDSFAQSIASGANAFQALGTAFLQFAAQFLRQIATMILQQIIFNAIAGAIGGAAGGASGGGATGSTGAFAGVRAHDGGVIGSGSLVQTDAGVQEILNVVRNWRTGSGPRAVNPSWFSGATRYHTGGIIGLAPNEVPVIAEEGEEMLTRDDPRHVLNGGATPSGGSGTNIKNIVVFDPAAAFAEALNTKRGEKALLTWVKNNPTAFNAAMGGR